MTLMKYNKQVCTQPRLHLTAFPFATLRGRFAVGAGRLGHLPEKVIFSHRVSPTSELRKPLSA
jgi:hypothetical protein